MNYIPSKELLSELGYGEVIYIGDIVELYEMQCLAFRCNVTIDSGRNDGKTIITSKAYHIALEVIANKCKVWATENKYTILTEDMYPNGYFAYVLSNKESIENYGYLCEHKVIKDIPHNKTEPEAIFRACEWIFDNRN